MIKFFRHIRQNLIMENKTGKYFKYAIGEIVLVVIGILIALSINNWNEHRKEHNIEISILNELLSDLNSDLKSLDEDIGLNIRAIKSNEFIQDVLLNNKGYHDSLDFHFGNIQYNAQFTVNSAGYENLKSRGFDIISNDTLRKAIIELHDRWYDYLFTVGNRNNIVNVDQFIPEYKKYFTNFSNVFKKNIVSFTPVNFEGLKGNTEFLQLLSYQKFINEQTVQVLDNTLNLIEILIAKLEKEIKTRS